MVIGGLRIMVYFAEICSDCLDQLGDWFKEDLNQKKTYGKINHPSLGVVLLRPRKVGENCVIDF